MAKTALEEKWIHIHESLMANKMPLDDLSKYVSDAKAYSDYVIDMMLNRCDVSKKALFAFLECCLVYYTYSESGAELITDTEYDMCMKEWVNMGFDPITTTNYNSEGLGTRWEIVHHDYPNMVGSLLKEYDINKFVKIIEDFYDMRGSTKVIHYAPKYDGNSIAISFDNGKMLRALTRKNGVSGQDVSAAVRNFSNFDDLVKLAISEFGYGPGAIKCEVLCRKDEYANSEELKTRYANCRSTVSGVMSSPKNLDMTHHLYAQPLTSYNATTKKYKYLADKPEGLTLKYELSAKEIEDLLEKYRSSDFPFRIDGVVAYVENEDASLYGSDAMATAYAFKVNSAIGVTKIVSSYFSIGRAGRATPMIEVEPCDVNETVVTDVNLSSLAKMQMLDLHIGDTVEIESAGDVIPMIKRVIKRDKHGEKLSFSKRCPFCDSKLVPITEGIIGCTNPHCPRVLSGQLANFFEALGMKGFSDEAFNDLVTIGKATCVYDVLIVTEEYLRNVIGWGYIQSSNFVQEIQKIKDKPVDEATFIGSLGIPGISIVKCKKILSEIPLKKLFEWIDRGSEDYVTEAVADIDGFGMKSARVFGEFMYNNIDDIKKAMNKLNIIEYRKKLGRFTLTGFTDDTLETKITNLGYEVGGLTKDTIALIAADKRSNSGKAQKAKKYGIPIITADEFDSFVEKLM